MLLRLRWLTVGMLLAVSGGAFVVTRMVRLRRSFTVSNFWDAAVVSTADGLDWMAARLRGSTTPEG